GANPPAVSGVIQACLRLRPGLQSDAPRTHGDVVSAPSTRIDPRQRLAGILPDVEIAMLAPLIEEIEELKARRKAVVLAHNYMTPDIFHGVADLRGDSLALARMAAETDAEVIVMAGVHFMAETAKIVNEQKTDRKSVV